MASFKEIVTTFAKQSLGGLAGEILLEDYCKKFNIKDLSLLNEEQQARFIDAFLWGVFHRHFPKEKIDSLRLQLNLQFCVSDATKVISKMLGKKISMKPLNIKMQSFEKFQRKVGNLEEGFVLIPVELSGYIKATALIFIYKDSAPVLGNVMLKSMLGIDKSDDHIDDMKMSAITEFFSIVVPTFADKVANTLNQEIFLNMVESDIKNGQVQIDKVMEKINLEDKSNSKVKKILSSPLSIFIQESCYVGGMGFLLMESDGEILSQSMNKTKIKADDTIEEVDLQKIEIPKDINRYRGLTIFLKNFITNGDNVKKIIEELMEDIGIESLNTASIAKRRKLANRIVEENFSNNSPKVVEFVYDGCISILGL